MPPLRTRTRNPRPTTRSPYAPATTGMSSLSVMKSAVPILDTIAVVAETAPVSSPSRARHIIDTLEVATSVRNQAAIAEALIRANHMLQSNRAENTKKAYIPKKNL